MKSKDFEIKKYKTRQEENKERKKFESNHECDDEHENYKKHKYDPGRIMLTLITDNNLTNKNITEKLQIFTNIIRTNETYRSPLTLFRMGRGAKAPPPISFSPVTSTNVEISPQNILTFSFNPFATLLENFKVVRSASPKLLNLNQDHPSKKVVFMVKSL